MAGGRPKSGVRQVLVGLDEETLAGLDALLDGRSRSDVLREAAAEWIERRSGGVAQPFSVQKASSVRVLRPVKAVDQSEREALARVLAGVPLKGTIG